MQTENSRTGEPLRIERAQAGEAEAIYAMYHALIDMPSTSWSEEYPALDIVEEDLRCNQVYVARRQGRIVSAIVLETRTELDGVAPWYPDVVRWCELGRLGVAREAQGCGVAGRMLAYAMEQAARQGYEAVRFLVSVENAIAQRAYARLQFDVCGEAELYDMRWLCYEKRLPACPAEPGMVY